MNLYYLGKGNNFGDLINELIFSEIFKKEVVRSRYYNAEFIGIGSVLGKVFYDGNKSFCSFKNIKNFIYGLKSNKIPLHVLGGGFIEDLSNYKFKKSFRNLVVHVLRGKLTEKILHEFVLFDSQDIALGDPGLLVSQLKRERPSRKNFEFGIIPHYSDRSSRLLAPYLSREDVCIIDIKSDPIEILNLIDSCQAIASSSLHGLIASDSLHVPNVWVKFSNNLTGGDFKFKDYYSVFGISPEPLDLRVEKKYLQGKEIYRNKHIKVMKKEEIDKKEVYEKIARCLY